MLELLASDTCGPDFRPGLIYRATNKRLTAVELCATVMDTTVSLSSDAVSDSKDDTSAR